MKSFGALFLIVIIGLSASWYSLLVVSANKLGPSNLTSSVSFAGEDVIVPADEGLAGRGKVVYIEMGCAHCHTQQVRRPGYGGDLNRDWGARQAVPRDYLLQKNVILGNKRQGPDLSNVGARHDAAWLYAHLFKPSINSVVTTMPDYAFLFKKKELDTTPTANALQLKGNEAIEEGYEIVPTEDAEALVAYLQSLNLDYDLPESRRIR